MAVIRDMMPVFELFQPATIDDAVACYGSRSGLVMAGGLIRSTEGPHGARGQVDLSQVASRQDQGSERRPRIGARRRHRGRQSPGGEGQFGLLMEAAELVASPQIRNQGTLRQHLAGHAAGITAGRATARAANIADTPTAINREHAISSRTVAVNPSDGAGADALDADW